MGWRLLGPGVYGSGEEAWDAIIVVVVSGASGSDAEESVEGEIVGGEIAEDNSAGMSSEENSVAAGVVYRHCVDDEMAGGNFAGGSNWESIAGVEGPYRRSADVPDDNAGNFVRCSVPVPTDANLVGVEVYYSTSRDLNTLHLVSAGEIPRTRTR